MQNSVLRSLLNGQEYSGKTGILKEFIQSLFPHKTFQFERLGERYRKKRREQGGKGGGGGGGEGKDGKEEES